MKLVLKWLGRILALLIVAALGAVGYVYFASYRKMSATYSVTVPQVKIPTDAGSIARGKYIAETVSSCVDCHGADFGGKVVLDNFPMGRLAAPNLTRGAGGLGRTRSDEDFVRALIHGVKPDGYSVRFMPAQDYRFTEAAVASLIAYIRSLPPVDREIPQLSPGPMARALGIFTPFPLTSADHIDHNRPPFASPSDPANAVAVGEELVWLAGCRGCHGADFSGGAGPPPGASNITPVGIGGWTEKDFFTAVRTHTRPNGTKISDTMPLAIGQMTDRDLQNIFAYLKTLPAKGVKKPSQQ